MSAFSDADRGFYLLLIAVCLSVCVVWALWEMDQSQARRRQAQADGPIEDRVPECSGNSALSVHSLSGPSAMSNTVSVGSKITRRAALVGTFVRKRLIGRARTP
jgi:hypothetical protein